MAENLLRILTWNLHHGGGERVTAIIDRIASHQAGVVVLSEYRRGGAGPRLRAELDRRGLVHQFALPSPPKANSVVIASRWPFGRKR